MALTVVRLTAANIDNAAVANRLAQLDTYAANIPDDERCDQFGRALPTSADIRSYATDVNSMGNAAAVVVDESNTLLALVLGQNIGGGKFEFRSLSVRTDIGRYGEVVLAIAQTLKALGFTTMYGFVTSASKLHNRLRNLPNVTLNGAYLTMDLSLV